MQFHLTFPTSLKRDIEHEQRVTLEVESWLNDRRIYLKGMHKFWTEKIKADLAAKDQASCQLDVKGTEIV